MQTYGQRVMSIVAKYLDARDAANDPTFDQIAAKRQLEALEKALADLIDTALNGLFRK